MKTTSSRHLSLVLALCAGLALLGASCKEDSVSIQATSTPKVAAPTTTPEQAWDMYVQGWKHQNLDEVLAACHSYKTTQDRCREMFNILKTSGRMEDYAKHLEQGTVTLNTEIGERRYYDFVIGNEANTVIFYFSNELGWRVEQ